MFKFDKKWWFFKGFHERLQEFPFFITIWVTSMPSCNRVFSYKKPSCSLGFTIEEFQKINFIYEHSLLRIIENFY